MTGNGTTTANADQAQYWNSSAGAKWIAFQVELDTIFQSVSALLFDYARPAPGERILDIGCGTGDTSFALAERIGSGGSVLGVDISAQLLEAADRRRQAAGVGNVSFSVGDAQTHSFAAESADLISSRFGVMFFEDPVAAFANMARALRPGGRLCFVCWAALRGNPWFSVPRDAAIDRLGRPPPESPNAPGPLAFKDRDYVLGILSAAGFRDASAEEASVGLFHPDGLDHAANLASNIGPANRVLKAFDGTPEDVDAIAAATKVGFQDYVVSDGISVPATVNVVQAVKP